MSIVKLIAFIRKTGSNRYHFFDFFFKDTEAGAGEFASTFLLKYSFVFR